MCPTWWLWKFKLCKLIKLQYSLITTRANTLWPYLCMDHLHPNNLVSTIVPKRGHAPQFCDEILNFQCCMTSFSHLVADLLNVRYIPQFWDEMTKFQCCKTSLPHIGAICILYFGNNATFPDGWSWMYGSQIWIASLIVGVACMDHYSNNLVSTSVPKRGHAPQFCDEILNFQCCMTSFSHLVADLLNVRYIPQFWDEMTKFQCCKTSLPHIGAHIHTLFWKQYNVSR